MKYEITAPDSSNPSLIFFPIGGGGDGCSLRDILCQCFFFFWIFTWYSYQHLDYKPFPSCWDSQTQTLYLGQKRSKFCQSRYDLLTIQFIWVWIIRMSQFSLAIAFFPWPKSHPTHFFEKGSLPTALHWNDYLSYRILLWRGRVASDPWNPLIPWKTLELELTLSLATLQGTLDGFKWNY